MVERICEHSWAATPCRRRVRIAATLLMAWFCITVLAFAALYPVASEEEVLQKKGTVIDASHSDQGYIMVKQKAGEKKLKLRVSLGKSTLTYDLNTDGEFEVFPLQMGSGKYKVEVFKQVSGAQYTGVSSQTVKAELQDEQIPFLYPNQYCWYDEESTAVAKAAEICAGAQSDAEKVQIVYDYVVGNVVYDYIRALKVQSGEIGAGYIPVPDQVLAEKKGICFDIAALVACMLRSQDIPTQLVIGYADRTYHAWNRIWVNGDWLRIDATSVVSGATVQQYTTERFY